jgi:peptide/nickel transport system substrate-binding protein
MSAGRFLIAAILLAAIGPLKTAWAFIEPPALEAAVEAGKLPPIAKRLPATPQVVEFKAGKRTPGRYGGNLRILMAKPKDVRIMTVYGYARLVGYNEDLRIVPDILQKFEVKEGRQFTLYLRKGHKWSDGYPFTAEDFRYYWQDVANNKELSPSGLNRNLIVDGKGPKFEVLNETTVRYTWDKPNPLFLPALAGSAPLYIYRPAHYMKQFHRRYTDPKKLEKMAKAARLRGWAALHKSKGRMYRGDNPDLPSLQPWVDTVRPPSDRFVFRRNPYYHRLDEAGRQLPYIDTVSMAIVSNKIIPAKTGAGETDLQARYLRFDDYTFLKEGEKRNNYSVDLWKTVKGAQKALYPNLNAKDPIWRKLVRDVRFRRALSLAINRHEINQVVYFGLARESNNTVLPKSPLFRESYRTKWAAYDLKTANKLLDEMGLAARGDGGVRLLANGEPLNIIVETAGESTEDTDILELISDSWKKIGVNLFTRSSQREVFRRRIFAGQTVFSIWSGLSNGIPTAAMTPEELAPSSEYQLQWPMWGNYIQTGGKAGEAPEMAPVKELVALDKAWQETTKKAEKVKIWRRMLEIQADQVFTIGIVNGALQPVVVNNALRNVPKKGFYNWQPGAYFGIYKPDTFWFSRGKAAK